MSMNQDYFPMPTSTLYNKDNYKNLLYRLLLWWNEFMIKDVEDAFKHIVSAY